MSDEAFYAKLQAFVGQAMGEPAPARDAVNQPMIRHWCEAVSDANPVYTDSEFAAASLHGGIVAPPTMLQAWTMPGLRPRRARASSSLHVQLFELLDAAGFSSVVATDCEQEYRRYLRPGDELTMRTHVESISAEKQTALGAGHFITQRMSYCDQGGEEVAVMRFRMLKFRPRVRAEDAGRTATAAPGNGRSPHPRPAITRDNAFFWEGLAQGRLLIQRCACGQLRHPPGPMCPVCHSLEWDTLEASGRGTLYSYVVAHHPPIPPFSYPNPIGLVELAEGTRLVANLVGVESEDLSVGLPLVCEIVEAEAGLALPCFRPVAAG